MELFEVTNSRAFPSAHALLIEPFKTIWEADDTQDKGRAIKVFSYIELLCSPKKSNPFFGYAENIRSARVKKEVFKNENYPDTGFMIQGVIRYKELLDESSPTYSLLITSLMTKDKLENFLRGFEPSTRNMSGTLVLKPKDITSALKEIPDVAKAIETQLEKVNQEIEEASKTRNKREIGMYER